MKIRDVEPGKTATIAEGPAKGRVVRVVAVTEGSAPHRVGILGVDDEGDRSSQVVRGDLEVE